jgi:Secretion system C-terminal sorting domain
MKSKSIFYLILLTLINSEIIFSQTTYYNNGNLSTGTMSYSGVTSPTGYSWSECQNINGNLTEANNFTGFNGGVSSSNAFNERLADDFSVPSGQTWNVKSIDFYCYQTNYSGTIPPIDALYVQIWNGDPELPASSVVAGDLITNVYNAAGSNDALMYRIFHSTIPNNSLAPTASRKIWKVRADIDVSLNQGNYWLVFQAHAINNQNVLFPPVTITGSRGLPSSNAKQYNAINDTWFVLFDTGNPSTAPDVNQDLPFQINDFTTLSSESFTKSDFELYPNPADTNINIVVKEETVNAIDIYDITGKLLLSTKQTTIDVSLFSNGVYIVSVKTDSGSSIVRKFIKK